MNGFNGICAKDFEEIKVKWTVCPNCEKGFKVNRGVNWRIPPAGIPNELYCSQPCMLEHRRKLERRG